MTQHDDIPTEPPRACEPARNVAVLVGTILIGVALAGAVMPPLFRRLPSDMNRTGILLERLREAGSGEQSPSPTVCVFGNSQVMNGVDARRMSNALPDAPEIWNLSSTGQDIFESYLYYQEIPDSIEMVIQCVTATSLEAALDLHANKYNAFVMYGYRPNEETLDTSGRWASLHAQECLAASDIEQRFTARWILQSATNFGIRRLLRSDLSLDRARQDLYAPRTYTRKVDEAQLQHLLREFDEPREKRGLHLASHMTAFLAHLNRELYDQGVLYVVVVLPEHPRSRERRSEQFLADLEDYCQSLRDRQNLVVINAIDLLSEEHFIDQRHADQAGANLFTDYLVEELLPFLPVSRRISIPEAL